MGKPGGRTRQIQRQSTAALLPFLTVVSAIRSPTAGSSGGGGVTLDLLKPAAGIDLFGGRELHDLDGAGLEGHAAAVFTVPLMGQRADRACHTA